MNREIRHWRMENRATASVSGRYSVLPTDYVEAIRLHLEVDNRPIELVSYHEMQTREKTMMIQAANQLHMQLLKAK